MSEPLPHTPAPDDDIQHALEQVHHADELNEGPASRPTLMMQLAASIPYPMPITTNRIVLAFWLMRSLWWGFNSAASKLFAYVKEHPWKSLGGLAGAGACGLLCGYFGSMVIIGEIIYAVRKKS